MSECINLIILGDAGADSGGEGKYKRAEKYGTKKSSLLFFVPYFPARLDFPASPLSAPGSPRMLSAALNNSSL